ncbi:VWA domain-containing protein [Aestuariivita sp.]|jgi:Ca-activated chloride channel family protein|uniref:vWA domain-containing protein n=1 Tax=Aestuariivita sp. TaxID=1872407 RepID=UPI00216EF616|nr:VWA domain-containing protein [Aestuariivita sp.]MCE8006674.1 VWA domain-containing protein [Aestuariivita sp.]
MNALAPLTLALSLAASATHLAAAPGCAADAMLVFDGSASMDELGFDIQEATRIVEARQAVREAMPDITPYRRVGLLVYGPGPLDACSNIDLRFGPIADAATPIIDAVEALDPRGLTPLAASVRQAAEALAYRSAPGIVVLVTDGNETCGGRPCALGDALAREAADLTVHVIGFKVVVDFFSWDNPEQQTYEDGKTVAKCLADRTGGLFVSTETVGELADALRTTLGCALIGRVKDEATARG